MENNISIGNHKIEEYKIDPQKVLCKSVIIYGKTNSGKSTMIEYILSKILDYTSSIFVISPTEPANNAYGQFLPKSLIHYDLEPDANGLTFVDKFFDWQEARANIYRRISKINTLEKLYNRYPSSEINSIIDKANTSIKLGKNIEQSEELKIKLYKRYILQNKKKLEAIKGLTEDEKYALEYININPYSILIFDDCAAEFKSQFKKPIFRKLFYQGRKSFITFIISCQSNTDLESNLRKNVGINIYTQGEVARSNFNLPSNGMSKAEIKKVNTIIPEVFKEQYRKLVHITDDKEGKYYYHLTADLATDLKEKVKKNLKTLCNRVEVKENLIKKTNVYSEQFKV